MNAKPDNSQILELPEESLSRWDSFCRSCLNLVSSVWTSTRFDESSLTRYAEDMMLVETRRGITVMALLSLIIQVAAIALYQKLGVHGAFFYTYGLLALLSIHVIVSVRVISDLSALNLLGMILLVITGVAIMSIAHRTGSLNAGLMSSIVLLFMVMPLVPWGLRESSIIAALTYLAFTFSFLSVEGRFEAETLWTVQFLIVASATTATLTIIRNTIVRKDDIRARYELEDAHRKLQLISTRDPLTGAWNRRFMEQNFADFAQRCHDQQHQLHFVLLDIDNFKHFNDTYGHHFGDLILQHLTKVFIETLPGNAHFVRLGGDEFAVLYSGDGVEQLVSRCLRHLATDPILLRESNGQPVSVTAGFTTGISDTVADLTVLYKKADKALYEAKNRRIPAAPDEDRRSGELATTDSVRAES